MRYTSRAELCGARSGVGGYYLKAKCPVVNPGVPCRSYRTCRRAVSNGVIRKIVLSEDALVAVADRFHAVLVFRIAWWQAPDNFLRAWRGCPEARSCLDDLTGTEFVR